MTTPGRTLKDYRPQHDEDCAKGKPLTDNWVTGPVADCSCGLDALLASPAPSSPTGDENDEESLRRAHRSTDTTAAATEPRLNKESQ